MTTYRHSPSGLVRNTSYRVDTISGSTSAAAIVRVNDDTAIAGSVVVSNLLGAGVAFEGPAATLYLKELGPSGVPTGTVVTSTGVAVVDPSVATGIDQIAAGLSGTYAPVLNVGLLAWTLAQAFRVVSATRDTNDTITTASVVWPDGSTGTFTTDTASTAFPGAIDAYHVTYVNATTGTKTVTQTAVTRNANGAVTAQPALTVA